MNVVFPIVELFFVCKSIFKLLLINDVSFFTRISKCISIISIELEYFSSSSISFLIAKNYARKVLRIPRIFMCFSKCVNDE